jgi:hypothetical protein
MKHKTSRKYIPRANWKKWSTILTLIPFVVAILMMVPRLASADFGLLDDASMLGRAQQIIEGDLSLKNDLAAGRFRPVYWFFYAMIYLLYGKAPFWFSSSYLLILLGILFGFMFLLKMQGAEGWQFFIASLLLLFSIPVIENFYTLSKGEPLQLFFLIAGVGTLNDLKTTRILFLKMLLALVATFSILLAMLTKETSIIMIPIALISGIYVWAQPKKYSAQTRQAHITFLIATLMAVGLFFTIRHIWGGVNLSEGTYTSRYDFSIQVIALKIARWASQLAFHLHYLLPLGLTLLLTLLWKKDSIPRQTFDQFFWSLWCLFWLGILMPWEYSEAYYLLPFTFGIAMITACCLPDIVDHLKSKQMGKKLILGTLLGMTLVMFLMTVPNMVTQARLQVMVDRLNQAMLQEVVKTAPEESNVLVNIQIDNEYTQSIGLYLIDQYERKDLTYDNIRPEDVETLKTLSTTLILLPAIKNQPELSVRMGIQEESQTFWNQRVLDKTAEVRQLSSHLEDQFQIININLPVILCPLIGERSFCQDPAPLIDLRWFSYGWEVYQIE